MKTKVRAEGNCVTARLGGKEAEAQSHGSRNKNRIRGRVSGHMTTKPFGLAHTVNAAIAGRKFTFLSGEICLTGRSARAESASPGNGWRDRAEVSRGHSRCRMQSGSSRLRETSQVKDRGWTHPAEGPNLKGTSRSSFSEGR